MDFFDLLAVHPKALEEFGETLKAHSAVANIGVMERYDFSGVRTLVDVGAGYERLDDRGPREVPRDTRGRVRFTRGHRRGAGTHAGQE